MTLNAYLNGLRFVKGSNRAMSWIDGIGPSFACTCILMKQYGIRGGKYLLKTPRNAISETLKFQNVPRCLGPYELVPLVRVPKLPPIHYQPANQKLFDSPEQVGSSFYSIFPFVFYMY